MTVISANHRYAIVGKSGTGKTHFLPVLASVLVDSSMKGWQVWYVDTKGDPVDLKRLAKWGYKEKRYNQYRLIRLKDEATIVSDMDAIAYQAYKRRKVLLIIDEYAHVCRSRVSAGRWLTTISKQGRGIGVGLIGGVQEPVNIPRILISQATHLITFNLTYQLDVDYMKKVWKGWQHPMDAHGFWWCDQDSSVVGDASHHWYYHANEYEWYTHIKAP